MNVAEILSLCADVTSHALFSAIFQQLLGQKSLLLQLHVDLLLVLPQLISLLLQLLQEGTEETSDNQLFYCQKGAELKPKLASKYNKSEHKQSV